MIEFWKDIPGYEGRYQVSNFGRIKSLDFSVVRSNGRIYTNKSRVQKPSKDNSGYLRCAFIKNSKLVTYKVHRLVADAFCKKPNEKVEVNHIDGNKLNNNSDNLEWVSRSENIKHAFRLGLMLPKRGILNSNSKLTGKDIKHIRDEYHYNNGKRGMFRKLSIGYGINKKTISQIVRKEIWSHV
jgi:hypothetical protein